VELPQFEFGPEDQRLLSELKRFVGRKGWVLIMTEEGVSFISKHRVEPPTWHLHSLIDMIEGGREDAEEIPS